MKAFCIAALLFIATDLQARGVCVHAVAHHKPATRPHTGFVVTTAHDTIRGGVTLNEYPRMSLIPHVGIRAGGHTRFIPESEVQYIRVSGRDTTISPDGYTEFFRLQGHHGLLRRLCAGRIEFLDESYYVDEAPGRLENLYVKERDGIVSISRFWSPDYRDDLIRYAGRRLGAHYHRRDFRSTGELMRRLAS